MNDFIEKWTLKRWIGEETKLVQTEDALASLARLYNKIDGFTSWNTQFGFPLSDSWNIEAPTRQDAACERARRYYDGLMMEGNEIPENIGNIIIYFNKHSTNWVKVAKMGKDYVAVESSR